VRRLGGSVKWSTLDGILYGEEAITDNAKTVGLTFNLLGASLKAYCPKLRSLYTITPRSSDVGLTIKRACKIILKLCDEVST